MVTPWIIAAFRAGSRIMHLESKKLFGIPKNGLAFAVGLMRPGSDLKASGNTRTALSTSRAIRGAAFGRFLLGTKRDKKAARRFLARLERVKRVKSAAKESF